MSDTGTAKSTLSVVPPVEWDGDPAPEFCDGCNRELEYDARSCENCDGTFCERCFGSVCDDLYAGWCVGCAG